LRRSVIAVSDVEHHAADERAEQRVDPELVGDRGEGQQDHERTADPELRGGLIGREEIPAQPRGPPRPPQRDRADNCGRTKRRNVGNLRPCWFGISRKQHGQQQQRR